MEQLELVMKFLTVVGAPLNLQWRDFLEIKFLTIFVRLGCPRANKIQGFVNSGFQTVVRDCRLSGG